MSMRRCPARLRWALCTALCALAGAGGAADPPDPVDPVEPAGQSIFQYQCAGGKKVTAIVDGSAPELTRTLITVEGDPDLQQIEMQQVMAASGVKSSNGKLVWWTRGDEGFLMEEYPPAGNGEMVIEDCKEVSLR